jgi:hypothetical protein
MRLARSLTSVEPGREDAREARAAALEGDRTGVDHPRGPLQRRDEVVDRRLRIAHRDAQAAGHVIAGAARHQAEGHARALEREHPEVDHAVAAHHDEGVGLRAHSVAGGLEKLGEVGLDEARHLVAEGPQRGHHGRADLAAAAEGGVGVDGHDDALRRRCHAPIMARTGGHR